MQSLAHGLWECQRLCGLCRQGGGKACEGKQPCGNPVVYREPQRPGRAPCASRRARDREQSRPCSGAPSTAVCWASRAEGTKCQWWKGNLAEESTARVKHLNFTAGYGTSVSQEHFSDKTKHFLSWSEQRNVFCNEFVIFCTVRFDNLQYFVM